MDATQGSAPPELSEPDAEGDKAFHTLQAQCARAGIELHRLDLGGGRVSFVVSTRGMVRTLDSLPQVQAYVKCLGMVLW